MTGPEKVRNIRKPDLTPYQREADIKDLIRTELSILVFEAVHQDQSPYEILPDYIARSESLVSTGFRLWAQRRPDLAGDTMAIAQRAEAARIFHLDVKAADTIYDAKDPEKLKVELEAKRSHADSVAAELGILRTPLRRVNPDTIPVAPLGVISPLGTIRSPKPSAR